MKDLVLVVVLIILLGGVLFVASKVPNTEPAQESMMQNLQIETLVAGTGTAAVVGDTVTVHYTGTFENGTVFDSSLGRGEPFSFTLGAGGVIEGWEQGILGMQIGEKRRLTIPPELGYGPNDYGQIPGNSTLIFEVELLSIEHDSAA